MNNFGTILAKLIALAGGAITGALLARWCDELLAKRAEERSTYDRTRYEQGLPPRETPPLMDERQG